MQITKNEFTNRFFLYKHSISKTTFREHFFLWRVRPTQMVEYDTRTKESIPSLIMALHIFDYNVPLIVIVRRSASPFSCIINMSQLDFYITSLSQEHFGKNNQEQYQEFSELFHQLTPILNQFSALFDLGIE